MAGKEVTINGDQVLVKSGTGSNAFTYQMLTQWLTEHPDFFQNNSIPGVTYDANLASTSGSTSR